jgi:hypothetical protein
MFSLALTQKWWMGLIAGAFAIAGVGTGLVAVPALADVGNSPSSAAANGVTLRLECHKGTWTDGSFRWTLAGSPVGSAVALPACPEPGGRRSVTLPPITMPGTGGGTAAGAGAATADGFKINVAGLSASGVSAACTFPSPAMDSKKMPQHLTFTCSADGSTRDNQAQMQIKVQMQKGDTKDNRQSSNNGSQGGAQGEDGKGKKEKEKEQDKGKGKGQNQGALHEWMSPLRRELAT